MSQSKNEGKKIEGHSYDGIEELDNSLPKWWINGFYATIVFSFLYFGYYVIWDGPSLTREWEHSQAAFEVAQAANAPAVKLPGEPELRALLRNAEALKAGQGIFATKCVSCHGDHAQGGIGPNLTDDYWIHGGTFVDSLVVVSSGVLDKGMPPWNAQLKPEELASVVAYVKSLRGTRPSGAKAPQGELVAAKVLEGK